MFLMTRRRFMQALGLSTLALPGAGSCFPLFALADGAGTGKNLILINLAGGFDSLAAYPYLYDPGVGNQADGFVQYLDVNRPDTFMLPRQNLLDTSSQTYLLNSYMGFSPAFSVLQPLWQSNKIKLIQSCGIEGYPNGSHNYCENCFSFGDPNFVGGVSRGWFARLIELLGLTDFQAFGFGAFGRADFVTSDPTKSPTVARDIDALAWNDPIAGSRTALNVQAAKDLLALTAPRSSAEEKIKESLLKSYDVIDLVNTVTAATNSGGSVPLIGAYPSSAFGRTIKSIARVIKYYSADANPKNRMFYGYEGGFDTHSDQGGYDRTSGVPGGGLFGHFQNIAQSLKALSDDLQASNVWNKSVIVVFSEFSRTAKQNGGKGTDHGCASTHMVMGGPVNGGVYGVPPTKSDLLAYNCYLARTAFQNEFAAAVRWFAGEGVDSQLFPSGSYTRDETLVSSLLS